MKSLYSFIVCALITFLPNNMAHAWAGPPVYLATVYSDYDSNVGDLYMLQGERGEALGVRTIERASRLTQDYGSHQLTKGIVLLEVEGRQVFSLRSRTFDPYRGGEIQLDYLKNAVTGNRDHEIIELDMGAQGPRLLHEGRPFRYIRVVTKRVLGRPVGIKELEFRP